MVLKQECLDPYFSALKKDEVDRLKSEEQYYNDERFKIRKYTSSQLGKLCNATQGTKLMEGVCTYRILDNLFYDLEYEAPG